MTLVSGTASRSTCSACLLSNTCFFPLLGCKTTERKECAVGGWEFSVARRGTRVQLGPTCSADKLGQKEALNQLCCACVEL